MQRGIAVFGGTFDPVHLGHLRSAIEVAEYLQLASVRLIPASQPGHREPPLCPLEQRLEMLRLAVSNEPLLQIDERECNRPGPSYMVDTLISLREEFGLEAPVILALGVDSFLTLPEWHRWEEIIGLAHILVLDRPGWDSMPEEMLPGLVQLLNQSEVQTGVPLQEAPSGSVLRISLTQLNISASQIRQSVANGRSVRYLLPDAVTDYIHKNGIYVS
jgi:nicotinate-nucleotide adenylyltransferase